MKNRILSAIVCLALVIAMLPTVTFAAQSVFPASEYAVILQSTYSAEEDMAYVKLGLIDDTQQVYAVGKTYLKNASSPDSSENEYNRPQDFANNQHFGIVVRYDVLDDGTADLSAQDFYEIFTGGDTTTMYYPDADGAKVHNGTISAPCSNSYFAYNDETVIFALYGSPCYYADSDGNVKPDATSDNYSPLRSRAYKLSELIDMSSAPIEGLYIGKTKVESTVFSYVLDTNKGANRWAVAAAMTVGKSPGAITRGETDSLGYVVSAEQKHNSPTGKYYATFMLINENGLFEADTVENVTDLSGNAALEDNVLGNIDDADGQFPRGSFIRFSTNDNGVITCIDNYGCSPENIMTSYSDGAPDGVYLINVTSERNGVLSFFDTDLEITDASTAVKHSCAFHEDGYDVITIDDDDCYAGTAVMKVSSRVETLPANVGNAVIEIYEGQIIRVFSFVEGYVCGEGSYLPGSDEEKLPGNVNGDESVDIKDAVRLFQYSMLPDMYPIAYVGNVDFTKDGAVDINDAVRLFQYSMLPDMYPIA